MKVGLVLECGPNGADKQVYEYLLPQLRTDIEIVSVTLSNKQNLLAACGAAVATLLGQGCHRVVIVWDLYPPWRSRGGRPCRHEDKEAIVLSLQQAGVTSPDVYLVCVQGELEAFLLADERALNHVLSRPNRPVRVSRIRKPERLPNPKKRLGSLYVEHSRRRYSDITDAIQIARAIPDSNRLARCPSFARLVLKAAGVNLR